jgi:hypothetical protein
MLQNEIKCKQIANNTHKWPAFAFICCKTMGYDRPSENKRLKMPEDVVYLVLFTQNATLQGCETPKPQAAHHSAGR